MAKTDEQRAALVAARLEFDECGRIPAGHQRILMLAGLNPIEIEDQWTRDRFR